MRYRGGSLGHIIRLAQRRGRNGFGWNTCLGRPLRSGADAASSDQAQRRRAEE